MTCHNQFLLPETSEEQKKEDKKKADKYQPQPESVQANPSNFASKTCRSYLYSINGVVGYKITGIIDPRGDLECSSLFGEVNKTLLQFSKVTSKWSGLNGGDHIVRLVSILDKPLLTPSSIVYSTNFLSVHVCTCSCGYVDKENN